MTVFCCTYIAESVGKWTVRLVDAHLVPVGCSAGIIAAWRGFTDAGSTASARACGRNRLPGPLSLSLSLSLSPGCSGNVQSPFLGMEMVFTLGVVEQNLDVDRGRAGSCSEPRWASRVSLPACILKERPYEHSILSPPASHDDDSRTARNSDESAAANRFSQWQAPCPGALTAAFRHHHNLTY